MLDDKPQVRWRIDQSHKEVHAVFFGPVEISIRHQTAHRLYAPVSGRNGGSGEVYRLDDLLHAMKQDAEVPPRRLKGKKYIKTALLIIDEVGFQPLSRQEASLLFRLVSWRYDRGATILTTNKSVKDWPEVLAGDEVMTAALLDRLLHRRHVFNIKGRSYRLRELDGALK